MENTKCNSGRNHDVVYLTPHTDSLYPLLDVNTRLIYGAWDGRDLNPFHDPARLVVPGSWSEVPLRCVAL